MEVFRVESDFRGKAFDGHSTGTIERVKHTCLIAKVCHEKAHCTCNVANYLADQLVQTSFVNCVSHDDLRSMMIKN